MACRLNGEEPSLVQKRYNCLFLSRAKRLKSKRGLQCLLYALFGKSHAGFYRWHNACQDHTPLVPQIRSIFIAEELPSKVIDNDVS